MRSRKTWQICEDCGIKTRSLRLGKDGFICSNCHNKTKTILTGKGEGSIFLEPLSESIQLNTTIYITKSQKETLSKRLNHLYPNINKRKELSGVTTYIRTLILNDLYSVESANADKETDATK